MKRSLMIAASFILICYSSFAQTPRSQAKPEKEEPGTKFEKLLLRKGTVLVKRFYDIGSIQGMYNGRMKLVAATVSASSDAGKVYALRFDKPTSGEYRNDQSGVIDFDEMVSLEAALEQMISLSGEIKTQVKGQLPLLPSITDTPQTSKPEPAGDHLEVVFSTRGGVHAGFFQSGTELVGFIAVNEYSPDATVYLPIDQLGYLKSLISKAKEKLTALGAH
jgi:hypothetical protein